MTNPSRIVREASRFVHPTPSGGGPGLAIVCGEFPRDSRSGGGGGFEGLGLLDHFKETLAAEAVTGDNVIGLVFHSRDLPNETGVQTGDG